MTSPVTRIGGRVSDEPTTLQTFAQYQLRFQVEESFVELKSNSFNLEASRLRDKFALAQLCGVIALTMLFLVLQGIQVVASGKRRWVDPQQALGYELSQAGLELDSFGNDSPMENSGFSVSIESA